MFNPFSSTIDYNKSNQSLYIIIDTGLKNPEGSINSAFALLKNSKASINKVMINFLESNMMKSAIADLMVNRFQDPETIRMLNQPALSQISVCFNSGKEKVLWTKNP